MSASKDRTERRRCQKQTLAATQNIARLGSLPTFAALAYEISVKPEGERRHCETN